MFCLVTRWVVGLSALLQSLNAEPIGDGDQLLLVQAVRMGLTTFDVETLMSKISGSEVL